MPSIEHILMWSAALLLLAVFASKISTRLGIPAILLFLGLGMLAGSDGPGGIWFDNAALAQSLGVVALVLILFAGGLETDWADARDVVRPSLSLATVGVALTAGVMGLCAHWLLGVSLLEGLLLGAVVSSTDAAAVYSVVRSQGLRFRGRILPLLEFESGLNDPMAVFLTIGFTTLLIEPQASALSLIPLFVKQMAIGGACGWVFGWISVELLNRIRLDTEGLYPVVTVATAAARYGTTASLGGSGFLAVYLVGILLGKSDFTHRRSLIRFHQGLAWLMQIAMFLTLGLLVFPSKLANVAVPGALLAVCLVLLARPISVFASLCLSPFNFREKLLVSWVGLRGAVPIILATFPLVAGWKGAAHYFDVVFFIVITSVLLQGPAIAFVAGKLGLLQKAIIAAESPLEFVPARKSTSELFPQLVEPGSEAAGVQILDLRLPKSALIVLLTRSDQYVTPHGNTVLLPGDQLLILAEREEIERVRSCFSVS
jgi:potassium/hydrogen antiporter